MTREQQRGGAKKGPSDGWTIDVARILQALLKLKCSGTLDLGKACRHSEPMRTDTFLQNRFEIMENAERMSATLWATGRHEVFDSWDAAMMSSR